VLAEAGIEPNWIAGMPIGSINAAILAGNPPRDRIDRLREFWTGVASDGWWPCLGSGLDSREVMSHAIFSTR
jgi:NTE family protein